MLAGKEKTSVRATKKNTKKFTPEDITPGAFIRKNIP